MKKVLLTTFLAAFAVAAIAQDMPMGYQQDVNASYERVTERGPYLTNRFFDNIFLGVAGGVNMYMGEYDGEADFGDRIAPALDITLGKWITPSVGLRLQYNGLSAKGVNKFPGAYADGAPVDGYFPKKFNFMYIHGDVLWNLSNAISGYRSDRFWDFVPYIGFGYARSYNDKDIHCNDIAGSIGLLNLLRLSNSFDITIEARGTIFKSPFDGAREGGRDKMGSLTAGLQYNFSPKEGFKRPIYVAPADYTPYNQRINALENDLNSARERAERLQRELNAERNKPVVTKSDVPVSLQVFFKINSAVITDQGMLNLERIAKAMKATPDMKYTVVGYADSATGNKRINDALSKQRAEAVVKALTQKFGISASQVAADSKGGVNTHKNIELDRTVIIAQ